MNAVAASMPLQWQVVDWDQLDASQRQAVLQRPSSSSDERLRQGVGEIIQQVREQGDCALLELTKRLDRCEIDALQESTDELSPELLQSLNPVLDALEQAAARIRRFHAAGMPSHYQVETAPGVQCSAYYRPLQRVGLYIPAGSAPLISTLAMLAVPAQLAQCEEIILCSPAQSDGRCAPIIRAAAQRLGIQQLYRCGGAQAIAAMAYGSETIPRCDKIFGPGNAWVTEAKRQVASDPAGTAIDMPAGPSEVMIIADANADANKVALDLLSQAEHGPDSQVIFVSTSVEQIDAVAQALQRWLSALPRAETALQALSQSRAIAVSNMEQALGVANAYASEHLILQVEQAERWVPHIRHAGSVFVGAYTPESLGDYCSGTNHVLPTGGWARSHSGLSVQDFMKRITVQQASAAGLAVLGPIAETLAACEGLDAHRLAVSYRLGKAQVPSVAAESSTTS